MTYWEHICNTVQFYRENHDPRIRRPPALIPSAINRVECWYWANTANAANAHAMHLKAIDGADQARQFLSLQASFADVEAAMQLPAGTLDHMSCVIVRPSPQGGVDRKTVEEFYREGPSMEEQCI